jgi:hypothetical protein
MLDILDRKQSEENWCEISKAAIIVPRLLDPSPLLDRRPYRFSFAINISDKIVPDFCNRTSSNTAHTIESL